ncbi:MAG: hypothetical protein HUJ26_23170 [Planctomycetaceae bacterium]|nr:hypothetical protein [Planctomycetaceae bacterium]
MNDEASQHMERTAHSRRLWRRLVWACVVAVTLLVGFGGYQTYRDIALRIRIRGVDGDLFLQDNSPEWVKKHLPAVCRVFFTHIDGVELGPRERLIILNDLRWENITQVGFVGGAVTDQEASLITQAQALEIVNFEGCSSIPPQVYQSLSEMHSLNALLVSEGTIHLSDLAILKHMTSLKSLFINDCQVICDDQLTADNFPEILTLDLAGCQFSNQSLSAFLGLGETCRTIDLENTNVTDTGLATLEQFNNLTYLRLDKTSVTDRGILHLQHLKNLEALRLNECSVRGASLDKLKSIGNLKSLMLTDTDLNDDGMKALSSMTLLEELYLDGTPMTDIGLQELNSLHHLKLLSLYETSVSQQGIERLLKSNPINEVKAEHGYWWGGTFEPW